MEGNSITSFENLCKIFEMRIKLDKEKKAKTSIDILDNYEKYSKKIDSIYNNDFQKQLKPLISPGITLEKEEDRLRRLIRLLEERLDRRIELEDRFYNTTGKYITGLQIIVSESELEDKKQRLSLISRYLETSREIENVVEGINKLKDSLASEEQKREEYEEKNKIMEDELYSSFMDVIKNDEYYRSIDIEDINNELDEIRSKISETKETLDITKESVGSLVTNGLEDDYTSYVEEAEKSYYSCKNRELMLKLYKLVSIFEDEFKAICNKREKINELLEEKKQLMEGLSIETEDELVSFEKVLLIQNNTLEVEREVLENIANYTSRIDFKEDRLEELNEVNSSVEILAILKEYGLIDTYDSDDVTETVSFENVEEISNDMEEVSDDVVETPMLDDDSVTLEVYDPYAIVEVKDYPKTLNVGLAKLKGESVREKVNKKLNPKVDEFSFVDLASNEMINKNGVEPILENGTLEVENKVVEDIPVVEPTIDVAISEDVVTQDNDSEESSSGSELKIETPVWDVPVEAEPKPIVFDNNVNSLPVWNNVEPIPNIFDNLEINNEEVNDIGITSTDENSNNTFTNEDNMNNDMFWIPVSDAKLETKDFPNINIPFTGNFNGNDNFGFPAMNVKGE